MSSRRVRIAAALAVLATVAAVLAASSAGDGKASRRSAYAKEFAAGEGKALAESYCQTCHSVSLTTQQAKDSAGWEKTIGQMEKWGIKPTPAEHDTLRRYLLAHYGPRAR